MRITKEELKQIIKEEIESVMSETTAEAMNVNYANPRNTPKKADNTIDAQKLLKIIRRSTQNARKNPKLRSSEAFQQRIIPMHNHILRHVESNLAKIDKMPITNFYKVVYGAERSYPDGQPRANFDAVMDSLINDEYGSMRSYEE